MSSRDSQTERHLSHSRHTCFHCQKIIIDPEVSSKPVKKVERPTEDFIEFRNTFSYSVTDLLQACKDGCPFFERLLASIDSDIVQLEKNATRSVNVHFDLVSDTPNHDKTPSNVKKAKISCRWVDTDEELMDFDAVKRNTYAFEAERDDPASFYVLGRPSYLYVISNLTFEILRSWIQECEGHVDCMEAIRTIDDNGVLIKGPSRLLYLDPSELVSTVKIIETDGTEIYAALSYCWGKDSSMQLLHSTIDAWKDELPFNQLPQTIRDAIITTKCLGLEYLWVDRICIIQDDREDTKKELSAMAQIYQRSFLTISAASAPSAIDGFLQSHVQASQVMQASRIAISYRCPTNDQSEIMGIIGMKTIASRNEEFLANTRAVDSRAWTMREQFLSTRTVYFCTNMLVWKCLCGNSTHMHQEGVSGIPTDQSYMEPRTSLFEYLRWGAVVQDYTERNLRFPGDKLVAISALAERFAHIFKRRDAVERPRYLAGLWEHDLRHSLCWFLDPNSAVAQKRSKEYRAPSWSWASVDGTVIGFKHVGSGATDFEILDCGVELASEDMPYLSVISGYLILKGRVKEDVWDRKRQKLLTTMGKDYPWDDAPDGMIDALETDLLEDETGW